MIRLKIMIIQIIALNINGLKTPTKRHIMENLQNLSPAKAFERNTKSCSSDGREMMPERNLIWKKKRKEEIERGEKEKERKESITKGKYYIY